MKLYIFEHCPYCVRARMPLHLFNIDCELVYVDNDEVETPTRLIGKKAVPILEKTPGNAMGESLDIVAFFDKEYNKKGQIEEGLREEIKQWIDENHKLINDLYMPRVIDAGFKEFQTDSAIQYFIHKKEDYIGPFKKHKEKTKEYISDIEKELQKLVPLYQGPWFHRKLSYEDIHLFPLLRNLTLVKGIQWPKEIRTYIDFVREQTDIPLFDDQALA